MTVLEAGPETGHERIGREPAASVAGGATAWSTLGRIIARSDMRHIAQARLQDARALRDQGRYDGAVYVCGYAIEIALKARICLTLRWAGFPSTSKEFEGKQSFRTHDLDLLLNLCGIEPLIRSCYLPQWSTVAPWVPELRYQIVGSTTPHDMIAAAGILVRVLCRNC